MKPVCPYCGEPVYLGVSAAVAWRKNINQDGSIGKRIHKDDNILLLDAPCLVCPQCNFVYDCEHVANTENFEELDCWIEKHLEELYNWK